MDLLHSTARNKMDDFAPIKDNHRDRVYVIEIGRASCRERV